MIKNKVSSIRKNYIYNLIYQIFLIIVPIFTTPYVSRVLGVDGTGRYSFTSSILTYFTLFAALGFGYYAQRLVASHQGDKLQQSKDFWNVNIARTIPVGLTLIIYCVLAAFNVYGDRYTTLMWILTINVVSVAFDISFFFQGNEEFGKIVFRNVLIKCLSIAAVFIFVRNENDLFIYVLIQSLATILSNLSLWLYLPKYLVKVSIHELQPLKHLIPTIVLFLPTIATSIYTSLDKTMIGIITGLDSENGNYEYAERIVKMALTVVTSLGTVMIPRNSNNFAKGDLEAIRQNIYTSCKFVFLLGLPMLFGIIAVSDNLVPWYLGDGYDKVSNLMKILSLIIIIIGLSNIFGLQFLVPCKMDKKFTIAIITGAVTNFGLNCGFIYLWGAYGAAIATVIAETAVTGVMLFFLRKEIKFTKILLSSWKYFVSAAIMFIPCYFVGNYLYALNHDGGNALLNSFIIVAMGIVIYVACLFILRDEYFLSYVKSFINKLKSKIKKNENNS